MFYSLKNGFHFCPRMRVGGLRSKECDAMLAGTSHYPYTSATHDLFPTAKVQHFLDMKHNYLKNHFFSIIFAPPKQGNYHF